MGKRGTRRRRHSAEEVDVWVQATVRERLAGMRKRHLDTVAEIDRVLDHDGPIGIGDVRQLEEFLWPFELDVADLFQILEKPESAMRQYASEAAYEEHRLRNPLTERQEAIIGATATVWLGQVPSGERGVAHLSRDCYQFRAYRPARSIVEVTATMTDDLNHVVVGDHHYGMCGSCTRWNSDALVASGLARLVQIGDDPGTAV